MLATSIFCCTSADAPPTPATHAMPSSLLRWNLALTDIGFIAYWAVSAAGVLPPAWLYRDHANPLLQAWNWSFAPIDLLAALAGMLALAAARRPAAPWRPLALVSVTLTFAAGAMALAFWAIRQDFAWGWWLPNLYLLLWPLLAAPELLGRQTG